MTAEAIDRWCEAILPRRDSPWVTGSGGSWDLQPVEPISDRMLSELAQSYSYTGTPWNCRSLPLSDRDREYMYLLYYSMQGLVARMRSAEREVESLKAQLAS